MAIININREGTTFSINTQNVTYIAKFDEQTQTCQVFVDGYDNAFTLTESEYQDFLNADYSGGGSGGGMTPQEKQTLSDLNKYVVTGYDDGGVEPFSDSNAYIAESRGPVIKFDEKRETFDLSTYKFGSDDLSFLQGKQIYYVLANDYLSGGDPGYNISLDGFANKGEQYIFVNSTVGGVMLMLVMDKSGFPMEAIALDFPTTGGWWLIKVTQDDFTMTLQTQEIHGWFDGVSGGHTDGLLDRVTDLENKPSGGDKVKYQESTATLTINDVPYSLANPTAINQRISNVEGNIGTINTDINTIKSDVNTAKGDVNTLNDYVVDGYDGYEKAPFDDTNSVVLSQNTDLQKTAKETTFNAETNYIGTDNLSYLNGKKVNYLLLSPTKSSTDVFLQIFGYGGQGDQYLLVNSDKATYLDFNIYNDDEGFDVDNYINFESADGGWAVVRINVDNKTKDYTLINGYFDGVAVLGEHTDGLLDRVSALEQGGGGSSMIYNTATGILSGAKDENGNDVEFSVGTITIIL